MQTDAGGWTVFQRRQDASVGFFRDWQEYKNGFGNLNGNFWLGLEKIHRLTPSDQNILRVDLTDFTNILTAYEKYGTFSVASESEFYKLKVDRFSGKYDHVYMIIFSKISPTRAGSYCQRTSYRKWPVLQKCKSFNFSP
jgi:hypothetical protein